MAYTMDMSKIEDITDIVEDHNGCDVTDYCGYKDADWTFQFNSPSDTEEAAIHIECVGDGWFTMPHEYVVNRLVVARKCS
tara:strand:+ start:637 stop:876 length:240 start_codon:yes stop_codon:yes gene_type:complete